MAIHDVRLPENWSKGSSGGPEFNTEVVPLDSGKEYPVQLWTYAKHRYEIAHNIKTPAAIAELRAFHFARRGRRHGFLLKDWLDWTSHADGQSAHTMLDQPLGTGNGVATTFQLIKRYGTILPYDRPILWPVTGTLLVAKDGLVVSSGVSVARGTGIVTITPAPANGTVLTGGFEFDVPVAFQDDWLSITFDTINSRTAGSVQLREREEEA